MCQVISFYFQLLLVKKCTLYAMSKFPLRANLVGSDSFLLYEICVLVTYCVLACVVFLVIVVRKYIILHAKVHTLSQACMNS